MLINTNRARILLSVRQYSFQSTTNTISERSLPLRPERIRDFTPHFQPNVSPPASTTTNLSKTTINQTNQAIIDSKISTFLQNFEEANNSTLPSESTLESLALQIQSSHTIDFRTLINYKHLLIHLQSISYFQNKPLWFVYLTCYRPLISNYGIENYTMRVQKFLDLTSLLGKEYEQGEVEALRKLMGPDFIDTLVQTITLGDFEMTESLLGLYCKLFVEFKTEDFKTLWTCALKNGDAETLKLLEEYRVDGCYELISEFEKRQLLEIVASYPGSFQFLAKVLSKESNSLNSYKISLIVQSLSSAAALSLQDTLSLIQAIIQSDPSMRLSPKDFDFLIDKITQELQSSSVERKLYTPDETQQFRKPRKVFLQRVDIKNYLQRNHPSNPSIPIQIQILFTTIYLKALTKLTNITGVTYGYSLIPDSKLITPEVLEILFRSFARGDNDTILRRLEVYKFAKERSLISLKSWEFIFEGVLKGDVDLSELRYYLSELILHISVTDSSKIQRALEEKGILVEELLRDSNDEEIKPKQQNGYDLKEAQGLRRFHKRFEKPHRKK